MGEDPNHFAARRATVADDERLKEIRREKEAALDADDLERASELRDQEKQRLVELWKEEGRG